MSCPNWLKIVQEKNDEIHVGKIRQESIDAGETAAGSPTAATRKMARIIEQREATAKILVVGDGAFSAKLSDYAIKMGQRLDCEIVALSVFDKHSPERKEEGEGEPSHFIKRSELGGARFADKAAGSGVKFYQLAKIGAKEIVVDQVVKEIAGIRYVLSEPDDGIAEEHSQRVQLPVIATPGSR
ncbi:MAG: hypothetical protein KAS94_05420 [Desulfobulbaceae bacterium]|nr:hypothetical protein [Desulfobulbaceae bacterium]